MNGIFDVSDGLDAGITYVGGFLFSFVHNGNATSYVVLDGRECKPPRFMLYGRVGDTSYVVFDGRECEPPRIMPYGRVGGTSYVVML